MITGRLANFDIGARTSLEKLIQAFNYLKNCNFAGLENGRLDIDGANIFMTVSEYETKNWADKKAEQHRLYIDLHYLISGEELVGCGREDDNNQIVDKYDLGKDRTSFRAVAAETYLPLREGVFAIFFPEDIHRPGLDAGGRHLVRKAVIKIRV